MTLFARRLCALAVPAVMALCSLPALAAPTLLVTGGILTGAKGVAVGGDLYDVEFKDGTCVDLFNGCDGADDFIFNSASTAGDALAALLATVFVDSGLGNFDIDPSKTAGCSDFFVCRVRMPLAVVTAGAELQAMRLENWRNNNEDFVSGAYTVLFELDTSLVGTSSWAVWTRPAAVPEPSTLALVAMAGVSLLAGGRRRHAAKIPSQR